MTKTGRTARNVSPLLICALLLALPAHRSAAQPRLMLCSVSTILECTEDAHCERLSPETAMAPRFIRVDMQNRTIRGVGPGARDRSSAVRSLVELGDLLVLQGVDEDRESGRGATGWSLTLAPADGSMVLSLAGDAVTFSVFGSCLVEQ